VLSNQQFMLLFRPTEHAEAAKQMKNDDVLLFWHDVLYAGSHVNLSQSAVKDALHHYRAAGVFGSDSSAAHARVARILSGQAPE
jgi:hypothetical protein